jgi:hypothetical protein
VTERAELLEAIKAKAVVHGDFVLSSGQRADFYVDLRRILLDGRLAPLAGRVMLDLTWDLGYEAVGGLTMGADPVATAIMHAAASRGTPVNAFVVRKKEKDHGTQRQAGARGRGHVDDRRFPADRGGCPARGRGRGRGRGRPGQPRREGKSRRPRTCVPRSLRTIRPRGLSALSRLNAQSYPISASEPSDLGV